MAQVESISCLDDDDIYEEKVELQGGGLGRSGFTNCHVIPRMSERSILHDLEPLTFSEDIRNEAERIFQQLEIKTKRSKRRKKLLFYCVFNAYKSLGQSRDPKTVAEEIGMSPNEMTKALSMCSECQTGYRPPSVFHSPLQFLPEYYAQTNLDPSDYSMIDTFAKNILAKDPDLLQHYPQVVAAGILLYYTTINGITVDKKKFSELVRRSEMTINKMFKRISNLDNS